LYSLPTLDLFPIEEQRNYGIPVIAEHRPDESSLGVAAHLGGRLSQSGSTPPEGLDEGPLESIRVLARVPQNSHKVLANLALESDIRCVDADEVLGVTNAGPAAVVHETLDMLAIALNAGESQQVSGVVVWCHGRS